MLRRKQPVLYVHSKVNRAIIFTDGFRGVVCEDYVASLRSQISPLVILHDAEANEIPSDFYSGALANFHVVLATSPEVRRFSKWIKSGVQCLTMEPFSRDEVACLL
jgi:hypothetical protein